MDRVPGQVGRVIQAPMQLGGGVAVGTVARLPFGLDQGDRPIQLLREEGRRRGHRPQDGELLRQPQRMGQHHVDGLGARGLPQMLLNAGEEGVVALRGHAECAPVSR